MVLVAPRAGIRHRVRLHLGHAAALGFDGRLERRGVPAPSGRRGRAQVAASWDQTELTCTDRGEGLRDCAEAALDVPRIVLLGPAGDKYVLGPASSTRTTSRTRAPYRMRRRAPGWSVAVDLTADGTDSFETATEATVGSRIAIVVDGRIVSAPTVQTPITSGNVVVTSGLTERQATSLARAARRRLGRLYDK